MQTLWAFARETGNFTALRSATRPSRLGTTATRGSGIQVYVNAVRGRGSERHTCRATNQVQAVRL